MGDETTAQSPARYVTEYKRTCNECGKVWHSLAEREQKLASDVKSSTCTTILAACGGNTAGAAQSQHNYQTQQEVLDALKKCPECGSGNYRQEAIQYERR